MQTRDDYMIDGTQDKTCSMFGSQLAYNVVAICCLLLADIINKSSEVFPSAKC